MTKTQIVEKIKKKYGETYDICFSKYGKKGVRSSFYIIEGAKNFLLYLKSLEKYKNKNCTVSCYFVEKNKEVVFNTKLFNFILFINNNEHIKK